MLASTSDTREVAEQITYRLLGDVELARAVFAQLSQHLTGERHTP